MPEINNVIDRSRRDNRAAAEPFHLPVIAARFDKRAGAIHIAIRGLVRQFHGDAEPRPVEIHQRAILVKQDGTDFRRMRAGHHASSEPGRACSERLEPRSLRRSSPRRV